MPTCTAHAPLSTRRKQTDARNCARDVCARGSLRVANDKSCIANAHCTYLFRRFVRLNAHSVKQEAHRVGLQLRRARASVSAVCQCVCRAGAMGVQLDVPHVRVRVCTINKPRLSTPQRAASPTHARATQHAAYLIASNVCIHQLSQRRSRLDFEEHFVAVLRHNAQVDVVRVASGGFSFARLAVVRGCC